MRSLDEAARCQRKGFLPAVPHLVEDRLAVLVRQFDRLLRAARQGGRDGEDHGAVAVAHVPFSPLDVAGAGRFLELVARVNGAVLGLAPSRAPAPGYRIVAQTRTPHPLDASPAGAL